MCVSRFTIRAYLANLNRFELLLTVLETVVLPITLKEQFLECLKRFELLLSTWKDDVLAIKHYRHIYTNITIKITAIFVIILKGGDAYRKNITVLRSTWSGMNDLNIHKSFPKALCYHYINPRYLRNITILLKTNRQLSS